jgi:hypothetical protein
MTRPGYSLFLSLLALSVCGADYAQAQSVQDIIASNERAIAQVEAWAPKCDDTFIRQEINGEVATARLLLQSARVHQNDLPVAALISPVTPIINQLTLSIQSCVKIMADNKANAQRAAKGAKTQVAKEAKGASEAYPVVPATPNP